MKLLRHFTANEEKLNEMPFKRELSMQAYLIENPEVLGLDDDVFSGSDIQIFDEEVVLAGGRISKDTNGRIDILARYSSEYVAVVELKNTRLEREHLRQLEDYLHEKEQIIEYILSTHVGEISHQPKFVGILAGESIDVDLAKDLMNGYVCEGIPIAAITIKRFHSSLGGIYVTTDVYFKNKIGLRNYDKYRFRDMLLAKNRLVLEVVRAYVEDHPVVTFAELRNVFPDKTQGTAVFVTEQDALKIVEKSKSGLNRHFIKPNELIQITDATIAVSNQWGDGDNPNLPNFLEIANRLYPSQIRKDGE